MESQEEMDLVESAIATIMEKDDLGLEGCTLLQSKECENIMGEIETKNSNVSKNLQLLQERFAKYTAELEDDIKSQQERIESKQERKMGHENRHERIENELKNLTAEIKTCKMASAKICQEALQKVPKEKYVCGVLKNITNIEWDVKMYQTTPNIVRGALVSKSDIKPFNFDTDKPKDQESDIEDTLWNMMTDWREFKSLVESSKDELN